MYASLYEDDPEEKKEATLKAKKLLTNLQSAKRYIVMNKRTCQMATQEWIGKNITTNKEGKPELKAGKKVQPWIMTLHFFAKTKNEADLLLQLTAASPAAPLRCLQLETDKEETKMITIVEGYDFSEDVPEDEDPAGESDAESLSTIPGDELGLEAGDYFS